MCVRDVSDINMNYKVKQDNDRQNIKESRTLITYALSAILATIKIFYDVGVFKIDLGAVGCSHGKEAFCKEAPH